MYLNSETKWNVSICIEKRYWFLWKRQLLCLFLDSAEPWIFHWQCRNTIWSENCNHRCRRYSPSVICAIRRGCYAFNSSVFYFAAGNNIVHVSSAITYFCLDFTLILLFVRCIGNSFSVKEVDFILGANYSKNAG